MNAQRICRIVLAASTILSSNVLAADNTQRHAKAYPEEKKNYLYYLHTEPLTAVQKNPVRAPGSNLDVLNLFANVDCGQSAFLVLQRLRSQAVREAFDLNEQTNQAVYIYVVAATPTTYSLRRTITHYLGGGVARQDTATYRSYVASDMRLFTATPITADMVVGVHVVDARTSRQAQWPPFTRNATYSTPSPGINPRPYSETRPSAEHTIQTLRYLQLARTSTAHDVCTVQSFMCPAARPDTYMAAPPANCISEDQIVKIPFSTALAYKILPVLFSE